MCWLNDHFFNLNKKKDLRHWRFAILHRDIDVRNLYWWRLTSKFFKYILTSGQSLNFLKSWMNYLINYTPTRTYQRNLLTSLIFGCASTMDKVQCLTTRLPCSSSLLLFCFLWGNVLTNSRKLFFLSFVFHKINDRAYWECYSLCSVQYSLNICL